MCCVLKLHKNISALYITRGENQKGISDISVSSFYTGKSTVIHKCTHLYNTQLKSVHKVRSNYGNIFENQIIYFFFFRKSSEIRCICCQCKTHLVVQVLGCEICAITHFNGIYV